MSEVSHHLDVTFTHPLHVNLNLKMSAESSVWRLQDMDGRKLSGWVMHHDVTSEIRFGCQRSHIIWM